MSTSVTRQRSIEYKIWVIQKYFVRGSQPIHSHYRGIHFVLVSFAVILHTPFQFHFSRFCHNWHCLSVQSTFIIQTFHLAHTIYFRLCRFIYTVSPPIIIQLCQSQLLWRLPLVYNMIMNFIEMFFRIIMNFVLLCSFICQSN